MYSERRPERPDILTLQERERIIASLRAKHNLQICFHLMDTGVSPQCAIDSSYDAWEALKDSSFDPRLGWNALGRVSRVATMIAACEPRQ